ncbi:Scarecrow-like protein 9 [Striga hermonthica]|uniref:Scarecrow-like protein 9 n=1 Tax=Striga hermonthica TaxID=68872 RepID=A0A9N7RLY4_STRHE|nr:Scarecrow-like protein 9 [Striga hermonthica]
MWHSKSLRSHLCPTPKGVPPFQEEGTYGSTGGISARYGRGALVWVSPGWYRLAHYFADALEARLAGGRSPIYKSIAARKTKASDYLRAYYTSLASAPFKKISNFASIRTIINETRKADKVHVIDFGILYGFQWPTFIQRISKRENGPPRVKITGIDFPQPGFRPAERVEDTGQRLARYAEKFGVPFEYNAIARKWENIRPEDLKIETDEYLAVTCMYRGKNLPDESVMAQSCSRTKVLDLIRKIKPDIFIHGVVNGTYGAPFFLTRFREVLYHFSALFDMLEACVPREITERTLIEKEMFGREAFNVVACEGWERVERPETYKQWQVRNMRAGFGQVAFDREIVREAMEKVKMYFHKDFLIDEQSRWVLLGWRGRIVNAISCWKPV